MPDIEQPDDWLQARPAQNRRQGWDEAFRLMAERGDDELLDEDLTGSTRWDQDEWEWEWERWPSSALMSTWLA